MPTGKIVRWLDSLSDTRIFVVASPLTQSVHFATLDAESPSTVTGRTAELPDRFFTLSVPDSANAKPRTVPASVASTVSFDNATLPSASSVAPPVTETSETLFRTL